MRISKNSKELIIGSLRQAETGMPMKEIGSKNEFSDASFYKWRIKYVSIDFSGANIYASLNRRRASQATAD